VTDDQDFFFDEEETAIEEKPVPAAKAKKTKVTDTAAAPVGAVGPAAAVQTVTMTVAALIGVIALLVGVIIGIVIPVGGAGSVPQPTTTGTSATAPQLSEDQLQGGALPEGHPDISGMPTGTPGATGTPAP
jgi:hypothetical protein